MTGVQTCALPIYAAEGPEARRQVMGDLFGVQNGRKNREGVLAGLLDPAVMARKRAQESRIRDLVAKNVERQPGPSPFERIEEAEATIGRVALRHNLLEGAVGFNSQYFTNARTILRAAAESARPNGERLREFRESNRGSLEQQLFSPEPLYDPLEIAKLADSLT